MIVERFYDFGPTHVEPVVLAKTDTALVVIDMQYNDAARGHGFCAAAESVEPGSTAYYCDRLEQTVVPGIARLLDGFRARGMHVIYVCLGSEHQDLRDFPPRVRKWIRNFESATGIEDLFWSENPDYAVLAELAPKPGDTIVRKTTWGAFNSGALEDTLRGLAIRNLVITGCSTNACIETTARDAADRGYGTVLVDDCCADLDQPSHDATLLAFHNLFGRVLKSAEDVLAAIDNGQPA